MEVSYGINNCILLSKTVTITKIDLMQLCNLICLIIATVRSRDFHLSIHKSVIIQKKFCQKNSVKVKQRIRFSGKK